MEVVTILKNKAKERVVDKVLNLPEKEIDKLSIFLSGLEAGKSLIPIQESAKQQTQETA